MKAPTAQQVGVTLPDSQQTFAGARSVTFQQNHTINGNGVHIPSSFQANQINSSGSSPVINHQLQQQANGSANSQQNQKMSLGAEPFYLKQHYRDQLAFLDRDSNEGANICNVWVYNFEHELAKISQLLHQYNYVAMVSFFISESQQSFILTTNFSNSILISF